MNCFSPYAALLGLLALLACESQQKQQPAALKPAAPAVPAGEAVVAPPQALLPMQRGYHRYVGTLGRQPVVLELMLDSWHSSGFYYTTTGLFRPLQPAYQTGHRNALELTESNSMAGDIPRSRWCFDQPMGPLLSGTWTTGTGQQPTPFALREDYADAVRYETLKETLLGHIGRDYNERLDTSRYEIEYLHLLGPDTLRPVLARLQCPWPAQRRRARQALDTDTTDGGHSYWVREQVNVTLNEAGLLACEKSGSFAVIGQRHDELSGSHPLYDLRTGHELNLPALLRPGALLALRQRITQQALLGTAYAPARWLAGKRLPLPETGFAVTPAGLEAFYSTTPQDEPYHEFTAKISWAELRPFLRPGTPLNRILAARGLRPAR